MRDVIRIEIGAPPPPDELAARRTVRDIYRINFDFDFAAALRRVPAKSLVIEIVGKSADAGGFPRQGARLAAMMPDASSIVLDQTEGPVALFLLTGLAPMADAIRSRRMTSRRSAKNWRS